MNLLHLTSCTGTTTSPSLRPSLPSILHIPTTRRLLPPPISAVNSTNSSTMSSCSSKTEVYSNGKQKTLLEFVGEEVHVSDDLAVLLAHVQSACKRIAALVASPLNYEISKSKSIEQNLSSERDAQKPLDIISNEIILQSLKSSNKVSVLASEESSTPILLNPKGKFVFVTDPLDGSRNIDASIPTGTIFGVYNRLAELDELMPEQDKAMLNSLQSGTKLVTAGYVLYSSATVLGISFGTGTGTHLFTLDREIGEFVLTKRNVKIPPRGQIYSVNDARYFDWPEGLKNYIDTVRQGQGQNHKKYSARYICSLVADFHRTLLYGGITMNPRDHLRLIYEANPLSFLIEEAGGKGSDGKNRILSVQPVKLHQRLPLFLGSLEDMNELESYGDIQQKINPGYEV
ncbi:hypothetical protein LUZ60_017277 [Juncus effusus]|nr:hypothetical protein LUZ60_017277 [Juncus effusus]